MFGNLDLWFLIRPFLIKTDLLSISSISKKMKLSLREEILGEFLIHQVLRGKIEKIQAVVFQYPNLLTRPVSGTDYAGRLFYATPFQAMLWCMDILMGFSILAALPNSQAALKILDNLSAQFMSLEENYSSTDLVRLRNHPSLYACISEIKNLFRNQDAILFYKNGDQNEYYYLNKKYNYLEPLLFLDNPHDPFDHYAMVELTKTIQNLEFDTAKHSTQAEHTLITRTLNKCLIRNGLIYQYKGTRYQSSHYDFALIDAMKLCIQYESIDPSIAKILWAHAVSKKQKEWTAVVAHEFSQPGRNFCFDSKAIAKNSFKNYDQKRSLVFYDQDITKEEALIFPLDQKYLSSPTTLVKGSRYPNPVLGKSIFGSLPERRGWLSAQDFCQTDCLALEAIAEARKEGLEEIKMALYKKRASILSFYSEEKEEEGASAFL